MYSYTYLSQYANQANYTASAQPAVSSHPQKCCTVPQRARGEQAAVVVDRGGKLLAV